VITLASDPENNNDSMMFLIRTLTTQSTEQTKKMNEISKDVTEISTKLDLLPCKEHAEFIRANSEFRLKTLGFSGAIAFLVSLAVVVVSFML